MSKVRYVGGKIFVQFSDNDFVLQDCDKEVAKQVIELVQNDGSKEDIFALIDEEFKKVVEEVLQIQEENVQSLKQVEQILQDERFYVENNSLYRKGIPVSIPKVLADEIQASMNDPEQLDKLDKFWAWTSLIRKADSRESFYNYIKANKMPITKQGLVVAFRRAKFVGNTGNKELQEFVTQKYLRLRKNKKSTSIDFYKDSSHNYTLKSDIDGVKNNYVGNLKDTFLSFGQMEDYYESSHSGPKGKMQYRIGVESRISEEAADWSDSECSSGLHVAHERYNFNGFGDTPLAVIVNPIVYKICRFI